MLWLHNAGQKQLSAEHARYTAHHPDLRALLSDFIQHLLIDKPADVIDFCAQYFDAFSAVYSTIEVAGSSEFAESGVVGGGSGSVGRDGGPGNVVREQDGSKTSHDSPHASEGQRATLSHGSLLSPK